MSLAGFGLLRVLWAAEPARADVLDPRTCNSPGQPCTALNFSGICVATTCSRARPSGDGGVSTVDYACNLCIGQGSSGSGGKGGAGGGSGSGGTGGRSGSGGSAAIGGTGGRSGSGGTGGQSGSGGAGGCPWFVVCGGSGGAGQSGSSAAGRSGSSGAGGSGGMSMQPSAPAGSGGEPASSPKPSAGKGGSSGQPPQRAAENLDEGRPRKHGSDAAVDELDAANTGRRSDAVSGGEEDGGCSSMSRSKQAPSLGVLLLVLGLAFARLRRRC
ncbi:MAG TPA: hypothetical protein VJR89_25585 [Polyangiales bacterium]|nr:hypothetical protein [Polyangiales bacterium]